VGWLSGLGCLLSPVRLFGYLVGLVCEVWSLGLASPCSRAILQIFVVEFRVSLQNASGQRGTRCISANMSVASRASKRHHHQTAAHHKRSVRAPRPHSFSLAAGAGHQFVRVCLGNSDTIWRTIVSGGAEASNIVAGASMWPSSVVCVPGKLGRFDHLSVECARQSRVHFAVGSAVHRQRQRRNHWIDQRNQP
jgi:hypothetical protein